AAPALLDFDICGAHADMKFAQLLVVDRRRGMRKQTLCALRFGEGDDVADGVGTGHDGDQPIQTKGYTTVRRCAILQGIQQEAKFFTRFFFGDVKRLENLFLHVGTMDTHRTTADFPAVQNHIVGLGQDTGRIAFEAVFVAVFGAGEGMVCSKPASFVLVVFEHGEIDHPQWLPAIVEQTVLAPEIAVADFDAQGAHGVVDDGGLVGAKEDEIAVLCAGTLNNGLEGVVVNVFHDGGLQPAWNGCRIVHFDIRQALGTVNTHKLGVGVDFASGQYAAAGNAHGYNPTGGVIS